MNTLTSLCLFLPFLVILSESFHNHHRVRRKVIFSKSSKIFFRLNGKDNVLNHTEIFAHGWAIRVNFDLPDTIQRRYKFFKRDIHNDLQNNGTASLGISCIIKQVCHYISTMQLIESCGFLCQIGHIIVRTTGSEADFFKGFLDKCDYHVNSCPYHFQDSAVYNYG